MILLQFIIRYRWILAPLAGLFLLAGTYGAGYFKGRADQKTSLEIKSMERTIATQEKLNEIRNRPRDGAVAVKRLLAGTF